MALLRSNPRQVVHILVSPALCSIIWHWRAARKVTVAAAVEFIIGGLSAWKPGLARAPTAALTTGLLMTLLALTQVLYGIIR